MLQECALDFKYDNRYLSDYGFVICTFDSSSGVDIVDGGSKIAFKTTPRHRGSVHSLIGTTYDECVTATFDICKNPDFHNQEDMEISEDEYRDIVRWLNRRRFYEFRLVGTDVRYNAAFNIEKVKIDGVLYGIRLTMETDKPFGYGVEIKETWIVNNTSETHTIKDLSDEIGYIYPSLKITCRQSGNLSIVNKTEDCSTVIRNCSKGEVITIDGLTQIIQSSVSDHRIYEDFNFEFFKIGNTINNRMNQVSASLPCEIELSYSPIVKDTPNL